MGGGDESSIGALTDAQTAELREKVCELRRTLPDPSARDISDHIADELPDMAAWATANRVKKLNTKLNKEVKSATRERDGLEPDETDGPLVLEELGQWPSDTSLEDHLANDRDTRIFKAWGRSKFHSAFTPQLAPLVHSSVHSLGPSVHSSGPLTPQVKPPSNSTLVSKRASHPPVPGRVNHTCTPRLKPQVERIRARQWTIDGPLCPR